MKPFAAENIIRLTFFNRPERMIRIMEIKSILIKDTTKEERIRIVQEGLSQCGGACDFCNGCDNLGGGSVDAIYEPYINGEKELRQINEEYRSNSGLVK